MKGFNNKRRVKMIERNHKVYIFTVFLSIVKQLSFLLILLLLNFTLIKLGIALGVALISLIISYILWRKTTYSVDNEMIMLRKDILSKNGISVPLNKITTMDHSQNIILKAIGVLRLKIDTAAGNKTSEILLYLNEEKANELINHIHSSQSVGKKTVEIEVKEETGKKITIPFGELFTYGVLRSNLALALGVYVSIWAFLDDILQLFHIDLNFIDEYANNNHIMENNMMNSIIFVVLIIIVIFILSKIISIGFTVIKYLGFEVERIEDKLKIQYGVITQKKYTFDIQKINVLLIKQSFIMQLLGLYTIHISAIGYGDEAKEESLLYPVCKKHQIQDIVGLMLPEYTFNEEIKGIPPRARSMFFMVPIIVTLILTSLVTINIPYGGFSFVLLPLVIIYCYLNQRNTRIGFSHDLMFTSCGGFNKQMSIVRDEMIQAIDCKSHFFQRRKNLCTYTLYYFGKVQVSIKHLEITYQNKIMEKII